MIFIQIMIKELLGYMNALPKNLKLLLSPQNKTKKKY